MKNESAYAKSIATLIKKIRGEYGTADLAEPPTEPVALLVWGFLEWNATRPLAEAAFTRLMEAFIDWNDLRVSLPFEIIQVLGEDYPHAEIRVQRMREALHDIYVREHEVTLTTCVEKNKKQARQYIESLSGMAPYVAGQIVLMSVGGHAMPVDEDLVTLLVDADATDPGATAEEVAGFLERQVKAADGMDVHHALRAWVDAQGPVGAAPPAPSAPATPRPKSPAKPSASSAPKDPADAAKPARKRAGRKAKSS